MVGINHVTGEWWWNTCTRGLKRGASNSAETIPTNQPIAAGPMHFIILGTFITSPEESFSLLSPNCI